MDSTSSPHLDGHGIFTVIVFSIVSIIVNYPLRIPLPFFISDFAHRVQFRLVHGEESSRATNCETKAVSNGPKDQPSEAQTQTPTLNHPQPSMSCSLKKRSYLTINHVSVPLIGVILLLISRSINGQQIKDGVVGTSGIEPLDILALFISLAYIAISLDSTGLLRFLAFKICFLASGTSQTGSDNWRNGKPKFSGSGYTLFFSLYLFFWVLGVIVGNDPVILSGTAFLIYLTRVAGISPPSAWIWSQFVAANISSAVLVSSNPTNLVVANGFGISFTTYTAYMILPSAVSAGASLLVILLYFRNQKAKRRTVVRDETNPVENSSRISSKIESFFKRKESAHQEQLQMGELPSTKNNASSHFGLRRRDAPTKAQSTDLVSSSNLDDELRQDQLAPLIYIPTSIVPPDVNPRSVLLDPIGAIFGTVVMLLTLILLVVTSVTGGVKVYMVAVPGAVICLIRDLVTDYLRERKVRLEKTKSSTKKEEPKPTSAASAHEGLDQEAIAIEESIKDENDRRMGIKKDGKDEVEKNQEILSSNQEEPATVASTSTPRALSKTPSRLSSISEPLISKSRNSTLLSKILRLKAKLAGLFPTVTVVLSRLPFPLLPFALGYFILVESLAHVGFIDIMAGGLGKVCSNGPTVAAFFVSSLAVVLCNLGGTNIGSTILLTKSLQSPFFTSELPAASSLLILKTSLYSTAFGSNVGALGGTFSASLAGLLWKSGLNQGGIHVKKRQFAWWSFLTIFPALLSGTGILLLEVRYWKVGKELDLAQVSQGKAH